MSSITLAADSTITARIYKAVKDARKKGVTTDELQATLKLSRSSISARLSALKKTGLIVESGAFRVTSTGRPATVYVQSAARAKPRPSKARKQQPQPTGLKTAAEVAHAKVAAAAPLTETIATPAPVTPAPVEPPVPAAPPKRLKNHFVIVTDHSHSMSVHRDGAARLFNEQLDTIFKAQDQDASVTTFQFGLAESGNRSIVEKRFNVPPSMVERFDRSSYLATGNTPLYAAVVKAGQRALCDQDTEKSFVMIVLTDGEENRSYEFGIDAAKLQEFIRSQQASDRWTFVFLVPKGYKDKFVSASGVHPGNVQEWADIDTAREQLTSGMANYFVQRSSGSRSSKNWFTTDLSKISPADLARLKDITHEVKTWLVDKESEILTFINYKTQGGFKTGCGFYEIHKKEREFQDYKKLILYDKGTERFYADAPSLSVRRICGFPDKGTVAIDPGNHANFLLLGQSTSTNRLLGRGTRLVFWENAT